MGNTESTHVIKVDCPEEVEKFYIKALTTPSMALERIVTQPCNLYEFNTGVVSATSQSNGSNLDEHYVLIPRDNKDIISQMKVTNLSDRPLTLKLVCLNNPPHKFPDQHKEV